MLQFEINKYNVTELFAVHAKIVELDRAEDAGDTARTTQEKAIRGMLDQLPLASGDDGGQNGRVPRIVGTMPKIPRRHPVGTLIS